jgi:hypothetical protein
MTRLKLAFLAVAALVIMVALNWLVEKAPKWLFKALYREMRVNGLPIMRFHRELFEMR